MDIEKLTCEQVNGAIAKLRGATGIMRDTHYEYLSGDCMGQLVAGPPHPIPTPNYCHDWAACGPLLEELVRFDPGCVYIQFAVSTDPEHPAPWFYISLRKIDIGQWAVSFTESIARLWLEWKQATK